MMVSLAYSMRQPKCNSHDTLKWLSNRRLGRNGFLPTKAYAQMILLVFKVPFLVMFLGEIMVHHGRCRPTKKLSLEWRMRA